MAALLTDDQVTEALGELESWERDGDSIVRTSERASFLSAIQDVVRVAELAEAADHHPDIDVRWRTLTLRLSTHSDGGLTGKDVALARQIDAVLR